ncbi:MAG: elongation factor G [Kiritimatiellae bacterium]|nr:elongation factor G [Kiritimatiellia bacterium]
MQVPIANVRNFAILGHSGSGKTTLTDSMAYILKINDRLGNVANGSSVSDTSDEEKARKISIFASPFMAPYTVDGTEYKFVFTDTPGAPGFYGQMRGAIRAADFALIVVDASSGVQVGTRRAWRACKSHGLASIAFALTGLDKENADPLKALESIRAAFGKNCAPVTIPIDGKIVNILDREELPAELSEIKTQLCESAAETDEALMNEYFENGTLPAATIRKGLHTGIAEGAIHPVYCITPLKEEGVREMLDSLCRLLPAPGSRAFIAADGTRIEPDPAAPVVAQIWKTSVDPFLGQLSYVRVYSGTLKPGMALQNNGQEGAPQENVSGLLQVIGKKQTQIAEACPGDIVAIPKLKNSHTGDTLATAGCSTAMQPIDFPAPVTWAAVTAKTQADDDKLGTAIRRLLESDATLQCEKSVATKELVLKGIGDVHLDVAVALLKSQSNVNVTLSVPKVPYRETVTGKGDGHYKHKKQSGGHGQYAEVYLHIEPLPEGETDWFIDEIKGGVIPGNFIPAIEKGITETMLAGPLAGYPVQDVRSRVYFGSYHEVDSSEMAFKIATRNAFREGVLNAKPVLLEPVMELKITIPDAFMGAVTGDMPHKRGRLIGMEAVSDGMQVITAEAPIAELFRYTAELRSMTGGQGEYTMTFARYERVPENIAQKIIAAHKAEATQEDE